MSRTKEIIKSFRDAYNAVLSANQPAALPVQQVVTPEVEPPAALVNYTLLDGTTVQIDNLEVGGKILPMPVAAGSLTLQDGTVIAFDATGTITNVTPPVDVNPITVTPSELSSPEKMRAVIAKFAMSTNPDIANLALLVKALFESEFKYELQRKTQDEALLVYSENFAKQKNIIEGQNVAINGLFEVLESLKFEEVTTPTEDTEKSGNAALDEYRASKK